VTEIGDSLIVTEDAVAIPLCNSTLTHMNHSKGATQSLKALGQETHLPLAESASQYATPMTKTSQAALQLSDSYVLASVHN
jgi:hypothetical protein